MKKHELKIGSLLIGFVLIFSLIFSGCFSSSKETAIRDYEHKPSSPTNANRNVSMDTADARRQPMPMGTPGAFEEGSNSERYAEITENPFLETSRAPLSTFSIDVDTASYANVRRYINEGSLPPKDSVRIEELVNYFEYDYPQPVSDGAIFGEHRGCENALEFKA